MSTRVALLPELGLDLVVHGGDGDRFAAVFRATWDRVPEDARLVIAAHWAGRKYWPLPAGAPLAALIPSAAPPLSGAGGGVSPDGGALACSAEAVGALDDDALGDTIAHALARVWLVASSRTPADAALNGYADPETREHWAARAAETWGFVNPSLLPWR